MKFMKAAVLLCALIFADGARAECPDCDPHGKIWFWPKSTAVLRNGAFYIYPKKAVRFAGRLCSFDRMRIQSLLGADGRIARDGVRPSLSFMGAQSVAYLGSRPMDTAMSRASSTSNKTIFTSISLAGPRTQPDVNARQSKLRTACPFAVS